MKLSKRKIAKVDVNCDHKRAIQLQSTRSDGSMIWYCPDCNPPKGRVLPKDAERGKELT